MDNLKRMLDPATIAVIGASEKEESLGRIIIDNLQFCQERKIFAVNPNQKTVCNLYCYDSIGEIPEHVDLAIVASPAPTVPGIVDACGRAGVDGLIIISDGFREADDEGRHLLEEISRIKKSYPLRILGPGSLGVIRPQTKLCASRLRSMPEMGNIALLTQSSAFEKTLFDWGMHAHSFSMLASLGSVIDIDFGDLIDYLGNDPYTRSIMIYMEDRIGDIKKFVSAARGFARYKPIVLLKPPPAPGAFQGKQSHTDLLAGPEDVFDAVLQRAGVVRVREVQDLYDTTDVLYSRHLPRGPRLAIITNSAGAGLMAANRLIRSGGQLAQLSDDAYAAMSQFMPPAWSPGNPLDILKTADAGRYEKTLKICHRDPGVDGILFLYSLMNEGGDEELAQTLASFVKDNVSKPVIAGWLGRQEVHRGRDILVKSGIPAYSTPEEAARTYLYMYAYERNLRDLNETPSELPVDEAPSKNHLKSLVRRIARADASVLSDEDARKFLTSYGIPLIQTFTAVNADEAVGYADKIAYPVVLKISSPDIIFRQDVGGVVRGITTPSELKREYDRLIERVRERQPQAAIHGVTVQKMVEVIDYELILGAKKDPDYGAVILFGMGGIGVEIFRDFALGLPPLNQALAKRLMEDTRVYKMLQGYRGKTPADLKQLEHMIVSFSNLIVDFPEILVMDMNPVAVSDGKAVALDVRIILDRKAPPRETPYPHLVITPYPTRYVTPWHLRDGKEVLLRPIKPEDEPLEHEMFTTLSPNTLRERFYQTIKTITHEMHARFCNIDYDREMAIVAEIRERGQRRIIGIASFVIEPDSRRCEFSVIVHDAYQGRGLAAKLVDMIIGIADEKGLEEFYGYIEPTNLKMVNLTAKLGMVQKRKSYDLLEMSLRLR